MRRKPKAKAAPKVAAKKTKKGKGGAETEKKEAAEPKHVPARLVTWPAVLTALEGLCLSLLIAFAHM